MNAKDPYLQKRYKRAKYDLEHCSFTLLKKKKNFIKYQVTSEKNNYIVSIKIKKTPSLSVIAKCDCPDFQYRSIMYKNFLCRHAIAVLLKEEKLSYLLPLLIEGAEV